MPVHLTAFVKVLGRLVYRFQCVFQNTEELGNGVRNLKLGMM